MILFVKGTETDPGKQIVGTVFGMDLHTVDGVISLWEKHESCISMS